MKSRGKFENRVLQYLQEDSTTSLSIGGSEGGYNPQEGNIQSKDSIAAKDSRIPSPPGVIQTRKGAFKRKNKTKKIRKK
jgi:hypothetical protein